MMLFQRKCGGIQAFEESGEINTIRRRMNRGQQRRLSSGGGVFSLLFRDVSRPNSNWVSKYSRHSTMIMERLGEHSTRHRGSDKSVVFTSYLAFRSYKYGSFVK